MITGGFTTGDIITGEFGAASERAVVGEAIVGVTYLGGDSTINGELSGGSRLSGAFTEEE